MRSGGVRPSPEAEETVREDVRRMREALRAAALGSGLSYWQIEEALGLCGGYLSVIFAGKVELRVAHVFGILRTVGAEPRQFFQGLHAEEISPEAQPKTCLPTTRRTR